MTELEQFYACMDGLEINIKETPHAVAVALFDTWKASRAASLEEVGNGCEAIINDENVALSDEGPKCVAFIRKLARDGSSHAATWQPITQPGQVKLGDKLRFNIGDEKYGETAKVILYPGTDREEIIYNKSRNFYLITSMAIQNKGSQKNVEFLSASEVPSDA
jgi:hypothetical protein